MARRRQRKLLPASQPTATRALSFREDEPIGAPTGEDLLGFSTAPAVPRRSAGRLSRLEELSPQDGSSFLRPWGMGGRLPPMEAPPVERRPLAGRAPSYRPGRASYRLLQTLFPFSPALSLGKTGSPKSRAGDRVGSPLLDHRTRVCVRRRVRRQVLFAMKKHGRNGGGKPYRRNLDSFYSCR